MEKTHCVVVSCFCGCGNRALLLCGAWQNECEVDADGDADDTGAVDVAGVAAVGCTAQFLMMMALLVFLTLELLVWMTQLLMLQLIIKRVRMSTSDSSPPQTTSFTASSMPLSPT